MVGRWVRRQVATSRVRPRPASDKLPLLSATSSFILLVALMTMMMTTMMIWMMIMRRKASYNMGSDGWIENLWVG